MITRSNTKTLLRLAVLAMAMPVLTSAPVNAAIVLEEQFVYEPAMLDGLNGGTGFDGPWVATKSHGRDYYVGLTEFADQKPLNEDSGLSFSTLRVAGSALSRYGSAGRAEAHRKISAASQAALTGDNTTIWFSQLFAGPANNRNGVFIFGTQSIKHTDNPYELSAPGDAFGFATASFVDGAGGNGDGSINAIAFDNSIKATFVKGTYTPNPTTAVSLIVGKINWKPNGTPDEFFLFNVTDMSVEPAESQAFASIRMDFDQSAFNMIAMYDGTNSVTDEIRFGNTFADVMGTLATSSAPSPADGTLYEGTWATLSWRPGAFAASHDLYIGTNFDDVNDGAETTFQGNVTGTSVVIGFFGFPVPGGLVPGTTYYWRVDEVNNDDPNSPWKGDVWSFLVPPRSAYKPTPADGAKFVFADTRLSWTPGMDAKLHYIHFGDNFDDVNNATIGTLTPDTTYAPGALELGKTYYWRVDESNPPNPTVKGDVWSFTVIPDLQITDPNLVGWWKFETGAGNTVIDFSGHGNHGTIVDKVRWVPGQFNLALEFLGDNQGHVELPPRMVTTASGSVAMWVNTDQTGAVLSEGMFWYGTETGGDGFGGQNEIHIHSLGTGALGFWMKGTTTDVSLDGPTLAGNGWNHVAATWDQVDGCRLYFNGVQVDYQMYTGNVVDLALIRLGRPASNFRFLDGLLDDIRLFNRPITAAQISEIMTKGEDPLKAGAPSPGNGAVATIDIAATLTWSAGEGASQHSVYFGTDRDAVAGVDASDTTGVFRGLQAGTSYTPPEGVEWAGGPYYWRVDEHKTDGTVITGNIWSFMVADYLNIDDFEFYNDIESGQPGSNLVYEAWSDGYNNPTNGSTMGYVTGVSLETDNVHGGGKSVPLGYDNTTAGISEVVRTFTPAQNWTEHGINTLSLWFAGAGTNVPGQLYVKINGVRVNYDGDPGNLTVAQWQPWDINLAPIGVDLSSVTSLAIGIQGAGATGTLLLDDIRLTVQAP